jgi:DNA polymerase-3 subunit epsilon
VKQRSSSLIQDAALLLREGPRHTFDLAREVLGLSGPPVATSAAVHALLGRDRRFRVDEGGLWSVDESSAEIGPSLQSMQYAVVDVETTGAPYNISQRIIEIAVVEVAGGTIVRDFRTLVNPGCSISPSIFRLTGITDAMVASAPFFDQIADEIASSIDGRVFVAHNVRFDWSVLTHQLASAIGEVPDVHLLCTLKMARRLLPDVKPRHLEALASHFGVPIVQRHRAWGDAVATAQVLIHLLDEAGSLGIHDLHALQRFLDGVERDPHALPVRS